MVKLTLHEYKRCTLVKGDTREVKHFLKNDLKCKWRPLVGPGGWMFPTSRKIEFTKKMKAEGYVLEDKGKWKVPASEVDEDDAPLVKIKETLMCAPRPTHQVNELHQKFVDGGDDVNVMRGILPEVIAILSAPREKLGLDGKKMTAKARRELERKDQQRLRTMALKCIRIVSDQTQALATDAGLLQRSACHILELIRKYEAGGAQLENAKASDEWKRLRAMAGKILADEEENEEEGREMEEEEQDDDNDEEDFAEDEKDEGEDEEQDHSRAAVPVLGHGYRSIVEFALGKLGGKATAAAVCQWIEKNKDKPMVTRLQCGLNEKPSTAMDRPKGTKAWHLSVRSSLSSNSRCQLVDKRRHVWQLCTAQGEVHAPLRKKVRTS